MIAVDVLISFVLAVFLLALSPGPDNIYVLLQSIRFGKRPAFAVIMGLMTGCLVHTSLVAFGVSLLIVNNEVWFTLLKIVGAVYLLYLAYKVYQSPGEIVMDATNLQAKPLKKLFQQGFLMNVLNPKVSLFFLALFPGFLFADDVSKTYQFFVLGALFIMVSFIVFGTIAVLASLLKNYIERYPGAGKALKWMQIIVFVGIAVFILI